MMERIFFPIMKVSLKWISLFVNLLEKNPQKIAEVLTEKSSEIDSVHILSQGLERVVVGEILTILPHPNADRIRITETMVKTGEVLQIVCGGQNIYEGMRVPVALPGAILPNGIEIKSGKIRGVESNGMLCSAHEIGIEEDASNISDPNIPRILPLPPNAPIGSPVADILQKNDCIFEIENTAITNRPDLFSHLGFAREFVACGLAKWKEEPKKEKIAFPKIPVSVSVNFAEKNISELCNKYLAVEIEGLDGTKQSPEWMKGLLKNIGLSPINAIVDITNFVMFDIGTPIHAFDRERVGSKWIMRLSKKGETMATLDGMERNLPEGAIVLEDEQNRIFDLCGIMGGENSAIEDSTRNILLHVPIFNPIRVRRTALALDHRTDAATIYEKGVPVPMAKIGIEKAIELFLEIFPEAKIISELFEAGAPEESPKEIFLKKEKIWTMLTKDISEQEIETMLDDLGFLYTATKGGWETVVPKWRTSDIKIEEDILEEIARLYGVNRIRAEAPFFAMQEMKPRADRTIEKKIAHALVKNGFFEIVTLSFLGEKLLKRVGIEEDPSMIFLKNPLSEDISIMRTSLSPRLLEIAEKNRRFRNTFRIFESGKVFRIENGEKKEEERITALLVGEDFFTAKGIAEEIFSVFGSESRTEEGKYNLSFAHPMRKAMLKAKSKAEIKIFEIHPKILKEFHLPAPSSIVCLSLANFEELLGKDIFVSELPKFPGITYDVSLLCDRKILIGNLLKGLSRIDPLIVKAEAMEIWEGKGVPEGQKSVTLSFEFRAENRTLTEDEGKRLEKELLAELEKRGARFRFEEMGK